MAGRALWLPRAADSKARENLRKKSIFHEKNDFLPLTNAKLFRQIRVN
jgi:hypothetical protein